MLAIFGDTFAAPYHDCDHDVMVLDGLALASDGLALASDGLGWPRLALDFFLFRGQVDYNTPLFQCFQVSSS